MIPANHKGVLEAELEEPCSGIEGDRPIVEATVAQDWPVVDWDAIVSRQARRSVLAGAYDDVGSYLRLEGEAGERTLEEIVDFGGWS